MDPAPHPPAAGGQTSVEYVAVLALVAVLLAFAAPAVGGPDIPGKVQHGVRLGICVVAGDICGPNTAQAAGVAPCTLASRTDGAAWGLSAFSVDAGDNLTLTVAPQSDGTVNAMVSGGVAVGGSTGWGVDLQAGPVAFQAGPAGSVAARVQAARGWRFPDRAAAQRFLDGLPASLAQARRWPAAWHSLEAGAELTAAVGVSAGRDKTGVDLLGLAASGSAVLGGRLGPEGLVTIYRRASYEFAEGSVPLLPSIGTGRHDASLELSFDHGAPRELVLRTAEPSERGNRVTDTVLHLDLRDPSNAEVAHRLVVSPAAADDFIRRVRAVGVIERSASHVNDTSSGVSGSVKALWHFGAYAKRVRIRKQLVSASAWTAGSGERDRFDCTGDLR